MADTCINSLVAVWRAVGGTQEVHKLSFGYSTILGHTKKVLVRRLRKRIRGRVFAIIGRRSRSRASIRGSIRGRIRTSVRTSVQQGDDAKSGMESLDNLHKSKMRELSSVGKMGQAELASQRTNKAGEQVGKQ